MLKGLLVIGSSPDGLPEFSDQSATIVVGLVGGGQELGTDRPIRLGRRDERGGKGGLISSHLHGEGGPPVGTNSVYPVVHVCHVKDG